MVYGLASFVVLLGAVVLLILGVVLVTAYSARRKRRLERPGATCPGCQFANARSARFCARCGHELPTRSS